MVNFYKDLVIYPKNQLLLVSIKRFSSEFRLLSAVLYISVLSAIIL